MRNIKRNVAVSGAGAVIAGFGIGGVMTAQAAPSTQGSDTSVVQTDTQKGEGPEGTEAAESDDGLTWVRTPTPTSPATRTPTRAVSRQSSAAVIGA